jgi:hypothetical protein
MPQPPRRRPPWPLRHTTWFRHSQLQWLVPGITPRLGLGVGEPSWVLLYCTCQPWRGSSRSLAAVPPISTWSIGRIYSECPVKHVLYCTLQPRQQITLSASHPPHPQYLPPSLSIYTTLSSTHPRILCATSVHLVYLAPGHPPPHHPRRSSPQIHIHNRFGTHFSPPTGVSPAATPPSSVFAVLGTILN